MSSLSCGKTPGWYASNDDRDYNAMYWDFFHSKTNIQTGMTLGQNFGQMDLFLPSPY